jgi:hypothetical protein
MFTGRSEVNLSLPLAFPQGLASWVPSLAAETLCQGTWGGFAWLQITILETTACGSLMQTPNPSKPGFFLAT